MSSGSETKKFCEALADKFPKFTRVQMCMIRNPEYGIQLAPEAVSVLRDICHLHRGLEHLLLGLFLCV